MSYTGRAAYPRNTSNGDYGKFHFADSQRGGSSSPSPQYSSNGTRMVQHVHYPNCPNNHQSGKFHQGDNQNQVEGSGDSADGTPEYTIEYGEDAVRAALGGSMPDFQAQFQKQYGGMGDGDGFKVSPQQMQMINGGTANIAMLPVVLTSDEQGSPESQEPNVEAQGSTAEVPPQATEATALGQPEKQRPLKAKQVQNGRPVKYGRHVRPSYWNPEAPNPWRKKVTFGVAPTNGEQGRETNQAPSQQSASQSDYHSQFDAMSGSRENLSSQAKQASALSSRGRRQMASPSLTERAAQLTPKNPDMSLCGKCQKCKQLSSGASQTSLLTFPKYSNGLYKDSTLHQKLNTSSNLGQSAKNFRAIRFSSNHHQNFNLNM